NSYILSPRNVTLHPIGIPSLSLKFATDFFALVTTAFCPEMISRSVIAVSSAFLFSFASPTPMLITIFSSFGTCIIFLYPNFFVIASTISLLYCSCNLLTCVNLLSQLVNHFACCTCNTNFFAINYFVANLGCFSIMHIHYIGNIHWSFLAYDSALLICSAGFSMLCDHVGTFYGNLSILLINSNYFAFFVFIFTSDDSY